MTASLVLGPQPLSDTPDLPAGFVGIDDTTVPDDDLDLPVQWLGLLGCSQERSQNRRAIHRELEEGIEESGDLAVGDAGGLVELNAERDRVGSNLVRSGAKSIRGLLGVTALRPTPTLRAAFAVDAKLDNLGFDRRDVRLELVLDRVAHQFAAAVYTAGLLDWDVDDLVDVLRQGPKGTLAVARAGFPSGSLRLLLRVTLGEGSRLPFLCLLRLLKPPTKLANFALEPCNLSILGDAVWAGAGAFPLAPPFTASSASHAPFIGGADKELEGFPEESRGANGSAEGLTLPPTAPAVAGRAGSTSQDGGKQIRPNQLA